MSSMQSQLYKTPLEHRRLLKLAREYRQAGYGVVLYPDNADLPEGLQGCLVGLIAKNNEEVVVADVRSRETLTLNGSADLRRLAEKVQTLPGWRFNLVVTNPRPRQTHAS
jgi:hypothetical protein